MSPEELKAIEERQIEMQQTRAIFDLICSKLHLKYGEFFGFRDTRGFVVLNLYKDQGDKTRVLKVSETAEVLIDTHRYYSVHQSVTRKNILFFSELREKPENFSTTRKGILDENFQILVPAIYDSIQDINEESFLVSIRNYHGILNSRFEVIIALKFREIQYNPALEIFKAREQINEEGACIYRIYDKDGILLQTLEYGLVDFINSPLFYTVYDVAIPYDFYVDDSILIGRQGLMDQNFKMIIPPLYDLIGRGEKFIMAYDKKDAAIGGDYESQEALGAECYYTLEGGKWGVFDHGGNLVIPFEYNWIDSTFNDDVFLINPTGLMYYYQGEQEDGAWYVKDGLWGAINSKNEIIVPAVYRYNRQYTDKIVFFNRQSPDMEILDAEDALTIHF